MVLEDSKVQIDLTKGASHTLKNLGIVYLSLYLDHDNFSLTTPDTSGELLKTPGCCTENLHVSGVANTARHLLLLLDINHPLLGHHAGCLSGTKEVSPWTKIIEITFPDALASAADLQEVQSTLGFLQETLNAPFIGHNQRKIRQEATRLGLLPEQGVLSHDERKALPVIRRYVHGLHLGATDILLFGMTSAKLHSLGCDISQLQCDDLTQKWFERMIDIAQTFEPFFMNFLRENVDLKVEIEMKTSDKEDSIVEEKADPVENQGEVDKTLLLKMDEIANNYQYQELDDYPVEWDSLSNLLKPQRNKGNNTNKMFQLQSILAGVHLCVKHLRSLNLPNIRIVDFCSGAGHLGIFLAHHFPDCHIILVETKWGSLRYAKERIDELGLKNISLCLAHMEQFVGRFELGVSLHACGSLTDKVFQQCIRSSAAIVSSPCCYGKIVNSERLSYPKSERFREIIYDHNEFFKVSRLADHESNNENYMKCVDIDRTEHLREYGYQFVGISKLKPLTCSPKNNLVVAFRE